MHTGQHAIAARPTVAQLDSGNFYIPPGGATMGTCDTCGNSYQKSFEVVRHDGSRGTFDSFECAIHALAPTCRQCGCRIVGHGREVGEDFYCCAHCVRLAGHQASDEHAPI